MMPITTTTNIVIVVIVINLIIITATTAAAATATATATATASSSSSSYPCRARAALCQYAAPGEQPPRDNPGSLPTLPELPPGMLGPSSAVAAGRVRLRPARALAVQRGPPTPALEVAAIPASSPGPMGSATATSGVLSMRTVLSM